MRISKRHVRALLLGMALTASIGAGAASDAGSDASCCYPGSVIYYDDAGAVVGVRMFGCGDPGWGVTTRRSRAVNGCVM